ncbi:carboxypeptidase regulatory-like domain-containing protein [Candidatus Nomurabacteria bacterium]|nr:carboxypeptidase regulatory-like domain-containing protein [Candidatus Nomurabacteria bacterium]
MVIGRTRSGGFSLVEVVIASAILLLFFGGLLSGVKLMVELIGHSKAETGARSLALSKMEYIRSLNYDAIGTVDGVPSGAIPQTSTSTLNGIDYTERVLVLYVDRPEDGLEGSDENGILEDSKRIKVEYTWEIRGEEKNLSLVTDISPKGMETSSGGGTLIVNVFDSVVEAVDGASVRIYNDALATSTVDVTVSTNVSGRVIVPGVPPGGGYQITVTKSGYSTDQTYDVTVENPDPSPPHVAVASSTITTMYFSIDKLADLTLRAFGEPVVQEFIDEFTSSDLLAQMNNTEVSGGSVSLTSIEGSYYSSGYAYSTTTAPAEFSSWDTFEWSVTTSTSTSASVSLYQESGGVYTLVDDTLLPGNSVGFTSGSVDISHLASSTFPRLALRANLDSSDPLATPLIESWRLGYVESEPPIADLTFDLTGTKTIGSGVLKYQDSTITDADGLSPLSLEWDVYTITVDGATEGYDIKEVSGVLPYTIAPGANTILAFELVPHTTRTLHITVTDQNGLPLSGATVQLSGTGYSETVSASAYGQAFFGDLPLLDSFTVDVSQAGYTSYSGTITVNGNVMTVITLSPSS